jgi:hypothetical protein
MGFYGKIAAINPLIARDGPTLGPALPAEV